MWTITVHGLPATKGNLKCVGRGGRHVLIENDKGGNLAPWMAKVTAAGRKIRTAAGGTLTGPIAVTLDFYLPRPKTVTRAKRPFPTAKFDIDKLERAVFDALTASGVWGDDGQVCHVSKDKSYDDDHPAGLVLTLTPIPTTGQETLP